MQGSFSCSMWDLVPPPGIEPGTPALGVLTTGLPGKSLEFLIMCVHYYCRSKAFYLKTENTFLEKRKSGAPFWFVLPACAAGQSGSRVGEGGGPAPGRRGCVALAQEARRCRFPSSASTFEPWGPGRVQGLCSTCHRVTLCRSGPASSSRNPRNHPWPASRPGCCEGCVMCRV